MRSRAGAGQGLGESSRNPGRRDTRLLEPKCAAICQAHGGYGQRRSKPLRNARLAIPKTPQDTTPRMSSAVSSYPRSGCQPEARRNGRADRKLHHNLMDTRFRRQRGRRGGKRREAVSIDLAPGRPKIQRSGKRGNAAGDGARDRCHGRARARKGALRRETWAKTSHGSVLVASRSDRCPPTLHASLPAPLSNANTEPPPSRGCLAPTPSPTPTAMRPGGLRGHLGSSAPLPLPPEGTSPAFFAASSSMGLPPPSLVGGAEGDGAGEP